MFALARSPLASPAALQQAFASAFPFPTAFSGATRSAAASPILHSSSPLSSPRLNNSNNQAPIHRPRVFPLQAPLRTQSESRLNLTNTKVHTLKSILSPRPGSNNTEAERRKEAMRGRGLSFVFDSRVPTEMDMVGLGISTRQTTTTSTTQMSNFSTTSTTHAVRDRIPTPHPKKEGEVFNWSLIESSSTGGMEEVTWEVEPDYLPRVYDDTC
ncbi:hypothetical protein FRB95_007019 [Tulasnella sp. JGI-2019a]|nr:hypothetical protein FRB95_007019 [Tulasnella sp. JGI-2019a]